MNKSWIFELNPVISWEEQPLLDFIYKEHQYIKSNFLMWTVKSACTWKAFLQYSHLCSFSPCRIWCTLKSKSYYDFSFRDWLLILVNEIYIRGTWIQFNNGLSEKFIFNLYFIEISICALFSNNFLYCCELFAIKPQVWQIN